MEHVLHVAHLLQVGTYARSIAVYDVLRINPTFIEREYTLHFYFGCVRGVSAYQYHHPLSEKIIIPTPVES